YPRSEPSWTSRLDRCEARVTGCADRRTLALPELPPMHFEEPPASSGTTAPAAGPWYRGLTRYHWFVFVVAALGWLFDTMDQQLFNLARKPAVMELLHAAPGDKMIDKYSGYATTVFMVGWALGGLFFG